MLALQELVTVIPANSETGQDIFDYAGHMLFAAAVLILTIMMAKTLSLTIGHVLNGYSQRTHSNLTQELTPLVQRLANILAAFVGIIVILERFGIQASSLLVFLGGGSVAIALAAQDTLSNMIAGFVIMIDRPFRVGDRIKLPAGDTGDVYEIGLRSTKIMDFDKNLIISPNAELVKAQVVNYAYPHRLVRILVEVGVAYGTDTRKARKLLIALAKKHRHVLPDDTPEVFVMELGDSSVLLRLIARTDDFTKKFEAETDLREQIHEQFAIKGIDIPFPQRVLHFAPDGKSEKTKSSSKQKTVRRKSR
jgi:small-conductance mechanosensitive channel